VRVAEAAPEVAGHLEWGGVKTHKARTIRLPRSLAEELGVHLAGRPHGRDDLVFTAPRGGPLRESKFVPGRFKPAIAAANEALAQLDSDGRPELLPEELRLYDLRHTAASLMIRQGASIKAVQKQLGHATASITLDTYGHLFPDELEALAGHLEDTRTDALARLGTDPARTNGRAPTGRRRSVRGIRGCRRRGSNPHALAGPTLLRRGCLPIPALRR
jgi:hypothetical protein